MARDHARMQTKLWHKEDWRALTVDAQWTYEMLCQNDALSYVGVIDYRPGRFAVLAEDQTTRRITAAIKLLERGRWALVDRQTEELLVRTYVRHDGVMDRANMGKAVGRALARVVSLDLRHAILSELAHHYGKKPTLTGWAGLAELYPDVMDRVSEMASTMPFPMPSREA